MGTKYIESEKIWRSEPLKISVSGVGQAILRKLNKSCATNPQRVLEVHHESGSQLTVKDAISQTITIAKYLLGIGVQEGDTVILYSASNPKITPVTFACLAIGAPVNFFDINFEEEQIKYAFELLDPTVIIFEEEFKTRVFTAIESLSLRLQKLKHVLSFESETSSINEILLKPIKNPETFQPPDITDPVNVPAVLVFTSGSTGKPKIAMHSHAMVLQGLYNGWWHLLPGSVICILCELRWICVFEVILQPIFFEVKRIFCSKRDVELECDELANLINTHGITHYTMVPRMFLEFLRTVVQSKTISKLKSLRIVLLVGEVLPKQLVPYAGKVLPNCKKINCYGMTELPGMVVTDELVTKPLINGGALKDGFSVKIIDELGNPLGPNERGQLCMKSELPILGYLKNESANREAFLEGNWFNTQDFAFVDEDNLLNIVSRLKFLIRASGHITVVPSDVENIVESHVSVLTSALIGHPDPVDFNNEIATIFIVLDEQSLAVKGIEDELRIFFRKTLTQEGFFPWTKPHWSTDSCTILRSRLSKTRITVIIIASIVSFFTAYIGCRWLMHKGRDVRSSLLSSGPIVNERRTNIWEDHGGHTQGMYRWLKDVLLVEHYFLTLLAGYKIPDKMTQGCYANALPITMWCPYFVNKWMLLLHNKCFEGLSTCPSTGSSWEMFRCVAVGGGSLMHSNENEICIKVE